MGTEADKRESEDVKRVDMAIGAIQSNDLRKAIGILRDVIANTPTDYKFSYLRDGKWYVKHWDKEQFTYYLARQKAKGQIDRPAVWLGNAYGRAYFCLGFIAIQQEQWKAAIKCLDAGLRLEPEQASFRAEKANALAFLGDTKAALHEYDSIIAKGDAVTPAQYAMALRGRGVQLVDLGRLNEAESALRKSLQYEPKSEVALRELGYIKEIRTGGKHNKKHLVVTGGDQRR